MSTEPTRKDISFKTFFLVFIAGVVFLYFIGAFHSFGPPAPLAPTVEPIAAPRVGETRHLKSTDTRVVPVVVDDATFNALLKAQRAKDTEGVQALMDSGRLFPVENNTQVRILSRSLTMVEVRMLEGMYSGQSGWVPTEYVAP